MDPISIILGILSLLNAIPKLIEFAEWLWKAIGGVKDRKARAHFRRRFRAAVMNHADLEAKTLDQEKVARTFGVLKDDVLKHIGIEHTALTNEIAAHFSVKAGPATA